MDSLKVCININGKNRIFYTDLVQNYKDFLKKCEEEYTDVETMSKFWIDEDGDKVDISGDSSFKMFLKISPKKQIFIANQEVPIVREKMQRKQEHPRMATFTAKNITPPTVSEELPKKKDEKSKDSIHRRVTCDTCNMSPIIGFRYKCLECPDFDLCMNCEGKRLHCFHKMIRLPEPMGRRRLGTMGPGCPFKEPLNDFALNIDIPIPEFCERRRHGRHHKRHHSGKFTHGHGDMPNIVEMFSRMAGNFTGNLDDPEKSRKIDPENAQQEQNEEKKNSNENSFVPPQINGETIPMLCDPETIKAGVEVLKNLGQMFFAPFGIDAEFYDANPAASAPTADQDNTTKTTTKVNEKVTVEDAPPSPMPTPTKEFSFDNQGATGGTNENSTKEKPDGMDWTIVDKSVDENIVSGSNSSGGATPKSTSSVTEPKKSSPGTSFAPMNYAQLSKDLENHVREEQKKQVKTDYHKKPHINNAVIAMMAMGFSNEQEWLTHLLESCDGDISKALDLLKPVK